MVDTLREGGFEVASLGDGADVHRKSRIPVRDRLRWEEAWKLESQMRNAMGDNHVCVGVYAHPCVGIDRIPNSKESLEAGC